MKKKKKKNRIETSFYLKKKKMSEHDRRSGPLRDLRQKVQNATITCLWVTWYVTVSSKHIDDAVKILGMNENN